MNSIKINKITIFLSTFQIQLTFPSYQKIKYHLQNIIQAPRNPQPKSSRDILSPYKKIQVLFLFIQTNLVMWSQILNESRSQRKFDNRPLIILGGRHSGKRSLMDSLLDISKTTHYSKRHNPNADKMRLHGTASAIDYAYLNVLDMQDPDNRTHAKLEVYMVEQDDNPSIYSELSTPAIIKNAVFVIMLDFTNPWHFIQQFQKWVKFINELQQRAQLTIGELQAMSKATSDYYKKFKQPTFDENGKLKIHLAYDREEQQEQLCLDLPEGVLSHNTRVPLVVCVNKCDLQSQVLREESTTKICVILYNLRSLCVRYGASLVYTSLRNNSNLSVLYEYILHRAYDSPLRFKPEPVNEEAIFIPFGYDKPSLIDDSVVKIDVTRPYNEVIPVPVLKKTAKEEILIEEDSTFFDNYIKLAQNNTSTTPSVPSQKQIEKPSMKKQQQVTDFFKNLLSNGPNKRESMAARSNEESMRKANAENTLMKHTLQVIQKKNQEE